MTLTHLISVLLHQGISVLLDDKNLLLVNCLSCFRSTYAAGNLIPICLMLCQTGINDLTKTLTYPRI
jgi:hypothetical protein